MDSKTTELRLSEEELAIVKESLKYRIQDLSEELYDSLEDDTEDFARLAAHIKIAQATRCKIDTRA